MGSGSRFKVFVNPRFWALGVFLDDFPFEHVVGLVVGPFQVEVGLGRAYDQLDELDVV